jgi:hypothetical protein
MNEKVSSSIQYQLTNSKLFYSVFTNWEQFYPTLAAGPDKMKEYLYNEWNQVKKDLENSDKFLLKDLDKVVSVNDFDVTYNKTKNGTSVFFITFPDYDYTDAASKYVALALTKEKPRYFTLEYSEHEMTHEKYWVIGEFCVEKDHKVHKNYGPADNMRLSWFAGYIMGYLESQNQ